MKKLSIKGISTRPGTHAVHMLSYYKNLYKYRPEDYPISMHCHNNSLAIPNHNQLTLKDINYIVKSLVEI